VSGLLRILALSGGGIRGILQSAFLERLEADLGAPLHSQFDLVAGTSTGGIVALAVAKGIPVKDLTTMYKHHGPLIFTSKLGSSVRRGARYRQEPLAVALRQQFGNARMGELAVEAIVTSSGIETLSQQTFSKTDDPDMSIVDAALATSAAPTYFPAVTPVNSERSFMDGGLWANDPSLLAVLYAHQQQGVPLENIQLLSVGTGTQPTGATIKEINEMRTLSPAAVRFILEFLMSAQSSFSDTYTDLLLPAGSYLRVNPVLPDRIALDDADGAIKLLPALGQQYYRRHQKQLHNFLARTGRTNSPIRAEARKDPGRRRSKPVVYWCGPHGERSNYDIKMALENHGFEVKLPDDLASDLSPGLASTERAAHIQRICCEAIAESDVVAVNLDSYGLDSAWEMGYAEANEKLIIGLDRSEDLLGVARKVNKRLYRDNFMHGWDRAYTSPHLDQIARRCAGKVVYLFCPYKNEDAIKLIQESSVSSSSADLIISNQRLGLDPEKPRGYSREARGRAIQFLRQADVILTVLPRYGMDTAWKLGYAEALGKELIGWNATEFGGETSEANYLDHWMHGWRKKPVVSTIADLARFVRGI
jgi:predicted acylesterase/phospholipase RssA/nucleoside 2-deoxyribosyltransferase